MFNIHDLLLNWDIKELTNIKILKGNVNENYLVKTKTKDIILRKVNLEGNSKRITQEFIYLDYLREKKFGYHIPEPIKTNHNKIFFQEGDCYYWIYEFIPGSIKSTFNEQQIGEIANMMRNYHRIIKDSKFKVTDNKILKKIYSFNFTDINTQLRQIKRKKTLSTYDFEYGYFSEMLLKMLANIDFAGISELNFYRLHRDLNPDNLIWDNNKLIGVIDFENVSSFFDPLIKDIAVSLLTCCSKFNSLKPNLKFYELFLKTYIKNNKLSEKESKLILDFILEGLIEDYNYFYWLLNNNPEKIKKSGLDDYKEALIWFNDNKDSLNNVIFEILI